MVTQWIMETGLCAALKLTEDFPALAMKLLLSGKQQEHDALIDI
jgi:hypothetical protein